MPNDNEAGPSLAEIEEGVLTEGREWMRQRLQQKLQEKADLISQSFSPREARSGSAAKKGVNLGKQCRSRPGRD